MLPVGIVIGEAKSGGGGLARDCLAQPPIPDTKTYYPEVVTQPLVERTKYAMLEDGHIARK